MKSNCEIISHNHDCLILPVFHNGDFIAYMISLLLFFFMNMLYSTNDDCSY